MTESKIPEIVTHLIKQSGGDLTKTAALVGVSVSTLTRWRDGAAKPRLNYEKKLKQLSKKLEKNGLSSNIQRLTKLESILHETLAALRESVHRHAKFSSRQENLDFVSALIFAHVRSIETAGPGISRLLKRPSERAANNLSQFVLKVHAREFGDDHDSFFVLDMDENKLALEIIDILDQSVEAIRDLHGTGHDDLVNEVFGRFVSDSFVDEKEMGQYLTPPEVVNFMVELGLGLLSKEQKDELLDENITRQRNIILDPSCGVGSFLAAAMRRLYSFYENEFPNRDVEDWAQNFLKNRTVGIDKSNRMVRLAKTNLALFGFAPARMISGNALDYKYISNNSNNNLKKQATLILTNPPFGAEYAVDDLQGLKLAKIIGSGKQLPSELLFLERYLDWLSADGVLIAVVPDNFLTGKGAYKELRKIVSENANLLAVISFPAVTFAASGTSAKTSVIALRKKESNKPSNKKVYFGVVEHIGYKVVTRSGVRRRTRTADTDLPMVLSEALGQSACSVGRFLEFKPDTPRWDAQYFAGSSSKIMRSLTSNDELVKVSDIAEVIDNRRDPRRFEATEFNYIEISDVDVRTTWVGAKTLETLKAPSRARKCVRSGDVLVSTVRPERGAIGVVPKSLDGAICSTGFVVLRPFQINPHTLAWVLKGEFVKSQMLRENVGVAYPAITEETCKNLILPIRSNDIQNIDIISDRFGKALAQLEDARKMLNLKIQDQENSLYA